MSRHRCFAFQPPSYYGVVLTRRHSTSVGSSSQSSSRTLRFTTRTETTKLGLYVDHQDDDDDTHKRIAESANSNKIMKLDDEVESENDKKESNMDHQNRKLMMIPTTTKSKEKEKEEDDGASLSSETQNIMYTIFRAATSLYSVFIIGFATIVGCGLILNIMGYGYHFDIQQGRLVIDSIEQMRTDRQLQQELMRVTTSTSPTTGIQQMPQSKPFSLNEYFIHHPFFTTLLITGVVLGVETWFNTSNKDNNNEGGDK